LFDSSGFLALINPRDRYHEPARAARTRLTHERFHVFSTNFVLAETHALFLARLSHVYATTFLREIRQSDVTIVRISALDERRAEEIIFQYADKNFSFTDATSFAVMERLHVGFVLTSDRDFQQYRFISLYPLDL